MNFFFFFTFVGKSEIISPKFDNKINFDLLWVVQNFISKTLICQLSKFCPMF